MRHQWSGELEHALRRGAKIYAEIDRLQSLRDIYDAGLPASGEGAIRFLWQALTCAPMF